MRGDKSTMIWRCDNCAAVFVRADLWKRHLRVTHEREDTHDVMNGHEFHISQTESFIQASTSETSTIRPNLGL